MPSRSADLKQLGPPAKPRRVTRATIRDIFLQGLVLLGLGLIVSYLVGNGVVNLRKQGITSGFDFLKRASGFGIIQHLIPYSEESSYGRAFLVSLLNTVAVSVLSIVLASICGFLLGIARISKNAVVAKLSLIYVEIVRNIPLLLQLFFWYFGVLRSLPMPDESFHLGKVIFLNIRGLYLPHPFTGEWPQLGRFNIEGGICLLPELVALILTLTTYTAAFMAEIVRAGLLSVSKGQWEGAFALGLTRKETLRFIIIPQALKVIFPPLTSQWLNLSKNSSLGAAVGYPELTLVFAGTVLLQTGQALEVMALTMSIYLTMSLLIALLSSWYQKRFLRSHDSRNQARTYAL